MDGPSRQGGDAGPRLGHRSAAQACTAGGLCPGVGEAAIGVDSLAAVPLGTCSRATARGRLLQGVPQGPSGGSSAALLSRSSLVLDRLLARAPLSRALLLRRVRVWSESRLLAAKECAPPGQTGPPGVGGPAGRVT
jgi:hypothetical protein